ncbi:MAG: CheY-like chemotaxis protein [Acidimicrobiales bacterium]
MNALDMHLFNAVIVKINALDGTLNNMKASKKILIIEDEKSLGKVASNKLQSEGFEVLVLPDGVDALEVIQSENPDLVLLDLIMPHVDGFTVLKTIKENPDLRDTKVIVLSNLSQDTDVDEILKLGAEEFLVKSDTSLGEVVEAVKRHLS